MRVLAGKGGFSAAENTQFSLHYSLLDIMY
jgi:hypothetical protein